MMAAGGFTTPLSRYERLNVTIRPYQTRDAAALAALYVQSVEAVGRRFYSAAQIAAWVSLAPTPDHLHALTADGRTRLVAVGASDHPVAFVDLEVDGHIHFLYVAPEAAGQGLGKALLRAAEAIAREHGLARLYAEASEAAVGCFLGCGFNSTERRDFEVAGVGIHNYAVEKARAQTLPQGN